MSANSSPAEEADDASGTNGPDGASGFFVRTDRIRMPDLEGLSNSGDVLSLDFDDGTAEGTYSNSVLVRSSAEEVVLDFLQMIPGGAEARYPPAARQARSRGSGGTH